MKTVYVGNDSSVLNYTKLSWHGEHEIIFDKIFNVVLLLSDFMDRDNFLVWCMDVKGKCFVIPCFGLTKQMLNNFQNLKGMEKLYSIFDRYCKNTEDYLGVINVFFSNKNMYYSGVKDFVFFNIYDKTLIKELPLIMEDIAVANNCGKVDIFRSLIVRNPVFKLFKLFNVSSTILNDRCLYYFNGGDVGGDNLIFDSVEGICLSSEVNRYATFKFSLDKNCKIN